MTAAATHKELPFSAQPYPTMPKPPKQEHVPIFHERALWDLEDISAYSRFSTSHLRDKVVCLPDFPPAIGVTPTSHPRWRAGLVWEFFEARQR